MKKWWLLGPAAVVVIGVVVGFRMVNREPTTVIIDRLREEQLATWLPVCSEEGPPIAYVVVPLHAGIGVAKNMSHDNGSLVFASLEWIKMPNRAGGEVPDVGGQATHILYDALERTLRYTNKAYPCSVGGR